MVVGYKAEKYKKINTSTKKGEVGCQSDMNEPIKFTWMNPAVSSLEFWVDWLKPNYLSSISPNLTLSYRIGQQKFKVQQMQLHIS